MGSGDVIVVWSLLTAHLDLGCINLPLLYIITEINPLIKGCIYVMDWQWSYHSIPLFALGKSIVSLCVSQSTCIAQVINYIFFSWCTTTCYSRMSNKNGNCFFCWNIPSIKKSFLCFGYILSHPLLGLWCICCILGAFVLNESLIRVISNSNSNKAKMPNCLSIKMFRSGY